MDATWSGKKKESDEIDLYSSISKNLSYKNGHITQGLKTNKRTIETQKGRVSLAWNIQEIFPNQ